MIATSVTIIVACGALAFAFISGVFWAMGKGIGNELGRALIAETAPALARWAAILAALMVLHDAPSSLRQRFCRDLDSLVYSVFEYRCDTSARVRGILVVFAGAWSLMRVSRELVEAAQALESKKRIPVRHGSLGKATLALPSGVGTSPPGPMPLFIRRYYAVPEDFLTGADPELRELAGKHYVSLATQGSSADFFKNNRDEFRAILTDGPLWNGWKPNFNWRVVEVRRPNLDDFDELPI